jgi:hypothetical protein
LHYDKKELIGVAVETLTLTLSDYLPERCGKYAGWTLKEALDEDAWYVSGMVEAGLITVSAELRQDIWLAAEFQGRQDVEACYYAAW